MMSRMDAFSEKLWGVSVKQQDRTDHLEMIIWAAEGESYILQRLQREKRNGTVTVLDAQRYLYQTDVYDALEMLPWIRTFLGRIEQLECTNEMLVKRYHQDLEEMAALYGGE